MDNFTQQPADELMRYLDKEMNNDDLASWTKNRKKNTKLSM